MSHKSFATALGLVLAGLACGPSAIFAGSRVAFASVSHAAPAPPPDTAHVEAESRALALQFAPVFAQRQSGEHPERDRPLRVDFDGDWDARNDWRHLDGGVQHAEPVAYASSVLTETHAFLTYTLFYPRDWVEVVCVPYACHDNDLEVALVVVERSRAGEDARLVLVETKTHRDYVATPGAEVARSVDQRPLLEVESGGHGLHVLRRGQSSEMTTHAFVPEGSATPGESYRLLSLYDTLWSKRAPARGEGLWTGDPSEWLWYGGARQGRRGRALGALMVGEVYPGGVRPPWALQAAGQRGDWFLDPAFAISERHAASFAGGRAPAQTYVLNRYLDDLTRECTGPRCSPGPARPLTLGASPVAFALFVGLSVLSSRRSRRRAL